MTKQQGYDLEAIEEVVCAECGSRLAMENASEWLLEHGEDGWHTLICGLVEAARRAPVPPDLADQ